MKKIATIFILNLMCVLLASAQVEYGVASYYGIEFEGRPTASGETYSQNKLTAAHKTMKLGTIVKVTNTQNNKSVYVKINDRGPYIKGRVLDLSTKAAHLLGYRNAGTCTVKIETVHPNDIPKDLLAASVKLNKKPDLEKVPENDSAENRDETWKNIPTVDTDIFNPYASAANQSSSSNSNAPANDWKLKGTEAIGNRKPYFVITKHNKENDGFFGIQLGVFSDPSIIFEIADSICNDYDHEVIIEQSTLNDKTVYKLYIGKFQNKTYADALKLSMTDKFKDAFVVRYQ